MDNFNLQNFVKKSKDEFYAKLYEGKKEHAMEEEMHDDVKEEEKIEEVDAEAADRIEGLLNIPMKAKFISAGIDLINDFLEDEVMDIEDIVDHLGDELTKEYHKAAGHDSAVAIDEEKEEDPHEMDEVVKEEEEVEVEDTMEMPAEDVADVDMEAPEGEAEDNKEIFAKLVDAYESAKALGDDKLTRQLANTITYFNKSVIFGDEG